MEILSKNTQGKILKNDVLALSQEAKKAKLLDNSVINATIGSLFDDDRNFYTFKTISNLMKELNDEEIYAYAPTNGNPEFHNAVTKWVFGKYYDQVLDKMFCKSIPTPGGTGAVSNGIYNSLDPGQTLLLPDIYWGPYKNMADSNGFDILEYPFIVNGKFNLNGFISCCEKLIEEQGKVVTILNDPSNNPTGYSLSLEEFEQLITYMNSKPAYTFNIVYDIAYFDYYSLGGDEARKKFQLMTKANNNIVFNIAFSCSKTFSVYGLRLGAQIILSNNEKFVNDIYASTGYLARTRWSNVSKAGISLLTKITNNEKLKNEVCEEIKIAAQTINNRAKLFIEEANECGLEVYPYTGGFFITVISNDGLELAEKLKKAGLFVLGYKKAIRIAICSISIKDIPGMPTKIKANMN